MQEAGETPDSSRRGMGGKWVRALFPETPPCGKAKTLYLYHEGGTG